MNGQPGLLPRGAQARRLRLSRLIPWLRVVLSVGLLGWMVHAFDLTRFSWHTLQLPWVWLGLSTTLVQYLASALRWQFTANRLQLNMTLGQALREVYAASLLNVMLPGGLAGELSRVAHHGARAQQGWTGYGRSARIVLVDRLSNQAGLWLLMCASMAAWRAWSALGLALMAAALLLALGWAGLRWGPTSRPWLSAWLTELKASWFSDAAWVRQVALSLSVNLGCMAMFACATLATSTSVDAGLLVRTVPPLLLAMSLPVSVAGFGIREWTSAGLFSAAGLDPATGALVAVLYGLLSVLGALPGVAFVTHFTRSVRRAH